MKKKIMIVAGEASGDAHAAALVSELRRAAPESEFEFFGLTGVSMRASSVETVVRADDLAIMGLLEIGRALPKFWRVFQTLKRAAVERQPDAVILTDFPDFNLPLAKALKKLNFKIIYYVSPQLWAWRSHRVRAVRRDVDLLLAILPFEKKWYAARDFHKVEYIGHPLVGEVAADLSREQFCRKYNLNLADPIIALLPGSRRKELTRILPDMLSAAGLMNHENPRLQFVVALAPNRARAEVEEIIDELKNKNVPLPEKLMIAANGCESNQENETRNVLNAADAAAVASGTATLETALIGTPLVVCYKVSWHNWHTLRHLISVPHYGLVNLVHEERLAVELIQNDLNPKRLANELQKLLEPANNQLMRSRLRDTTAKLGAGGASREAAQKILDFLGAR